MNRFNKTISVMLILSAMLLTSGCSKNKEDENVSENESSTVTTTAAATSAASEKEDKNNDKKAAKAVNILTGKNDVSAKAKGKRPVAVMVNNIDASLPQYGVYKADMLFECPVEGGITRLMALYGDYTAVPNVCSVRSCRYYYALFANSFDAVYLHWGIDKKIAQDMLDKLKIDHIDGNVNNTLFKRDEQRMQSYDMEHTGYLDGGLVAQEIKNAGIRTDLKKENKTSVFNFLDKFAKISKIDCNKLTVSFSDYYSAGFDYDAKSKTYKKIRNGEKHIDASNNKQLEYTNVFVLESKDIHVANSDNGLLNVDWSGGTGYLASAGTIKRINWKKSGELDKLVFTDEKGQPVKINKGKTYIGVTKANMTSYSK